MLMSTHTRNTHTTHVIISADLLDIFRAWRDIHKYVQTMKKLQGAEISFTPFSFTFSFCLGMCGERVQGAGC